MRPSCLLATIPSVFALTLAAGCAFRMSWNDPDVWVEQSETFDIAAGNVDHLVVVTANGAITVRAAPAGSDTVHVTAMKRAGGDDEADARAAMAALNVTRRVDGNVVELGTEWTGAARDDGCASVAFDVTLPARFSARLESHNGACTATGLDGALEVVSHNGRLDVDCASERVAATTHNGAIEYRGPARDLQLETHNGEVRAALTGGPVNGQITSYNGAILVDAADSARGTIEGETRNGRVSVRGARRDLSIRDDWFRVEFTDAAAGRLEVVTHNGAIEVR